MATPGGVHNRLYDVRRGEQLTMPEIPCSYDTSQPLADYQACVFASLSDLLGAGVIETPDFSQYYLSAVRAFFEG